MLIKRDRHESHFRFKLKNYSDITLLRSFGRRFDEFFETIYTVSNLTPEILGRGKLDRAFLLLDCGGHYTKLNCEKLYLFIYLQFIT